jgi:23S rRNA pseudouridine1911/1915/1917 synthase
MIRSSISAGRRAQGAEYKDKSEKRATSNEPPAFRMKESLIIYEDNHLLVYNKQPGDIVQGDRTGDTPLGEELKLYLKKKFNKPGQVFLGVVHRLDRPVSGIVLFARTSKALSRLNKMLKEGQIKKSYWAVVGNHPAENCKTLEHYLLRKEDQNKSYVCQRDVPGAKLARLEYTVIGNSDRYFLLLVNLLTGRHHQIRAQLSHTGIPVKGDLKYGYPRSNPDGSIHLHSRQIEFIHPVSGAHITLEADPPSEPLWNFFLIQQQSLKEQTP